MSEPRPGDWVQVWGQVRSSQGHPEDLCVEFFSHSEQYHCDVRRDRVLKPEGLPGFVTTCTALYETRVGLDGLDPGDAAPLEDGDLVLLRCTKHEGHPGKHRHRGAKWDDHLTHGHIEET